MEEKKIEKTLDLQLFAGKVKLKLFILSCVLFGITGYLFYSLFFIPLKTNLLQQSEGLGESVIFSVTAVSEEVIPENNKEKLELLLDSMIFSNELKNLGLMQISVIMHKPVFYYYASTQRRYEGKQVSSAIREKIEKRPQGEISTSFFLLKKADKTIKVKQLLKDIKLSHQGRDMVVGTVQLLFDQEKIEGSWYDAIKALLIAGGTLLLSCVLVILYFFKAVSGGLNKILSAARQLVSEDYELLPGKAKSPELELLVDAIKEVNGPILPKIEPIEKAESKKEVSARRLIERTYFAAQLTGVSEKRSGHNSEHIERFISTNLEEYALIIKSFGGTIEHQQGNEIIASFSGEDMVDNAIKSGQKICQYMEKIQENREKNGAVSVGASMGIHADRLVIGNISDKDRLTYSTKQTMARTVIQLCQSAKLFEILITPDTFSSARGKYFKLKHSERLVKLEKMGTEQNATILVLRTISDIGESEIEETKVTELKKQLRSGSLTENRSSGQERKNSKRDDLGDMLEETLQNNPVELPGAYPKGRTKSLLDQFEEGSIKER